MAKLPTPVPVNEFPFPQPGPDMFKLVCKNHTFQEYLTKHAYQRQLHYLGWARECPCPFSDLIVTEVPDDYKEQ